MRSSPYNYPDEFIGPRITLKQRLALKSRHYYYSNHEMCMAKRTAYRRKHAKRDLTRRRISIQKNPEARRATVRKYYMKNRELLSRQSREFIKKRLKEDPGFLKAKQLRELMNRALRKGQCGGYKFQKIIGCTPPEFKQHLEKQFKPGMTWGNHARLGWHIDHIIPCSRFDFTKEADQRRCFHYTNTQPLWHVDNKRKWKYLNYEQRT